MQLNLSKLIRNNLIIKEYVLVEVSIQHLLFGINSNKNRLRKYLLLIFWKSTKLKHKINPFLSFIPWLK